MAIGAEEAHERASQTELLSALISRTHIQVGNDGTTIGQNITETTCIRNALVLVQALRTAYRYRNFNRLVQSHEIDYRCGIAHLPRDSWASVLCTLSSVLTIEDILREYVATPQGFVHVACQQEVCWYFKLVEDCISQWKLDSSILASCLTSDSSFYFEKMQGNNLHKLLNSLERIADIGAHYLPVIVSVGMCLHRFVHFSVIDIGAARLIFRAKTAHMVDCELWRVSEVALIIHDAINQLPSAYQSTPQHIQDVKRRCNFLALYKVQNRVNEGIDFYTSLLTATIECCIRAGGTWLLNGASTIPTKGSCFKALFFGGDMPHISIKCIERELINNVERTASIAARGILVGMFCSVDRSLTIPCNFHPALPLLYQITRLLSPYSSLTIRALY